MQYALLIYEAEHVFDAMSPEEQRASFGEYMTFTKDIRASGHFVSGEPLAPVSLATTVRVREGKRVVTDGPYAETREQLGGFYVVEAKDLDEALELAARLPGAKWGCIEVRPIPSMADHGAPAAS